MNETENLNLSRRSFLKAAGVFALGGMTVTKPAGAKTKRPNILFILADDLGYMDTALYGSRYYETPNIDALAQKGMMFTDSYSASPLCSPTRASIMTGKYPARLRLTTPACHLPPLDPDKPLLGKTANPGHKVVTPQSRRFLELDEYTIGEAFKDAGYKTGFIGKWHLGLQEKHWPRNQGFEFDLGAPNPGPPSYFSPYRFKTIPDGPKGEYITERVTAETLKYLDRHKDDEFMLCVWHFAVHAPFQAKEEITKKYRNKKDPRGKQDCAIMASMIQSLDESVGRIMAKLDELKIADNTIVIFFSDNGGNMYNQVEGTTPTNNAPLRGSKGNSYEAGIRVPFIVIWPGVVKPHTKCSEVVSSIDFYPTLLEMARITHNPAQQLDGISIVPLLKGREKLDREAIFCHFPHYVPATGNLPCTYVRRGDWKLMRLYGEGPDRANAYELYNLRDDISEKNNLAGRMPEKVKQLDKLIDGFLKDTDALIPVRNPAYSIPVAGWKSSQDCNITVKEGTMLINSTGGDPYIYCNDVPAQNRRMFAGFRMKINTSGNGMFFWADSKQKHFAAARRISFNIQHDGNWHDYSIEFTPDGPLSAIRIDPGTSSGQIEIGDIRLVRPNGEVLKQWTFDK